MQKLTYSQLWTLMRLCIESLQIGHMAERNMFHYILGEIIGVNNVYLPDLINFGYVECDKYNHYRLTQSGYDYLENTGNLSTVKYMSGVKFNNE